MRFTVGRPSLAGAHTAQARYDAVEDGGEEQEEEEEGRGGRTLAVEINGLALTVAHCSQRDLGLAVRLQGA